MIPFVLQNDVNLRRCDSCKTWNDENYCTKTSQVWNDVKPARVRNKPSENDVNVNWKVRDDSNLTVWLRCTVCNDGKLSWTRQFTMTQLITTANSTMRINYSLSSLLNLQFVKLCTAVITTVHHSTQSDRVDYWSDNIEHGNLSTRLDTTLT